MIDITVAEEQDGSLASVEHTRFSKGGFWFYKKVKDQKKSQSKKRYNQPF